MSASTFIYPADRFATGYFHAYRNAAFNLDGTSTFIQIPLDTEEDDLSGWFDVGTGRYTPQLPGIYAFSGAAGMANLINPGDWFTLGLFKNGSFHRRLGQSIMSGTLSDPAPNGSCMARANGSSDYFDLRAAHSHSAATRAMIAGPGETYLSGYLIGRGS